MLSAALLRFLHGERSGKQSQPPGWALSCSPPPPRPWLLPQLLRPLLWLFPFHPLWAFPSTALGLWIHPPIPAGSIPTAGCWLAGLGRRPAPSALPGQSGTTLASPQGPSSCVPLALPPHQPWLHRCCVDPNTVLCMGRAASTIL